MLVSPLDMVSNTILLFLGNIRVMFFETRQSRAFLSPISKRHNRALTVLILVAINLN